MTEKQYELKCHEINSWYIEKDGKVLIFDLFKSDGEILYAELNSLSDENEQLKKRLRSSICPECANTEFKKEYKSEHNIENYCTRCGLILKKDDLVDEYDDTGWLKRGFRPNSWDICYANHVTDYFKELSLDYGKYNEESDNLPEGYSRIPKKGEGNLSEGEVFQEGRIPYEKYLKRNSFKDNGESKLKYLRRYNQYEFNKCLEIIGNQNILKQSDKKEVHQPKYNYEKGGDINNI